MPRFLGLVQVDAERVRYIKCASVCGSICTAPLHACTVSFLIPQATPPAVMAVVTDYKLTDEVRKWIEYELNDYQNPQHWEVSKDEDGKTIWKKDMAAAGHRVLRVS